VGEKSGFNMSERRNAPNNSSRLFSVPPWFKGFSRFRPQLLQVRNNGRVRPFHRPNELAANDASSIDDVGLRPAPGAVSVATLLRLIVHGDQVYIVIANKSFVSLGIVIGGHGQHRHIITQIVLHLDKRGKLFDARSAPTSPEIQYNDFALVVMERNGSRGVGDGKVRRRAADQFGAGTAVTATKRKKNCNEHDSRDSDG
jgi:hypothetical protein